MKTTHHFNTGVIPANCKGKLSDGQVWKGGTKQIPFDCENVPNNATFRHASDNPDAEHKNMIVREMFNTAMVSKFAHFFVPSITAYDEVGEIMAYENNELDAEKTVVLFQHLIDNGKVWALQGHYGRMATTLIAAGHCHRKKDK